MIRQCERSSGSSSSSSSSSSTCSNGSFLRFTPERTCSRRSMRAQKELLREEVERVYERDRNGETGRGQVRILFDLTGCAPIELRHLLFAISVLVREEAFMRRTLDRTCALIRPNRAVLALCDLFFGLYTPVRPFKVVCAEGEAERFLFCGKLADQNEGS